VPLNALISDNEFSKIAQLSCSWIVALPPDHQFYSLRDETIASLTLMSALDIRRLTRRSAVITPFRVASIDVLGTALLQTPVSVTFQCAIRPGSQPPQSVLLFTAACGGPDPAGA
jgi:hypothetical protein